MSGAIDAGCAEPAQIQALALVTVSRYFPDDSRANQAEAAVAALLELTDWMQCQENALREARTHREPERECIFLRRLWR